MAKVTTANQMQACMERTGACIAEVAEIASEAIEEVAEMSSVTISSTAPATTTGVWFEET